MKRKSNFNGFTLIELIMVIVIIAIIASVTLPKFTNFKIRAIEKSEDYIMGALHDAIQTVHLSYVVMGSEDSWPCSAWWDNPFSLLAQAPPIQTGNYWGTTVPCDNMTWHYVQNFGEYAYYIHCPHYVGICAAGGSKGRIYIYCYGWGPWYFFSNSYPGSLWLNSNAGH